LADRHELEALYREAFPDEDLYPLVHALLADTASVLSLAGAVGNGIVAHAAFTTCTVEEDDSRVALLGPLAVSRNYRRRGVGTAAVAAGIDRLRSAGIARILVLGDPDYYGRLGFAVEDKVAPPYPMPDEWREAWQSLDLAPGSDAPVGRLSVPAPWRDESLWLPPAG
jgi:putative acetyltransferase